MGRYRGRLDIIADILKVASNSAKKTQIMFKANLSYNVLQRYLKAVTAASLLSFEVSEQTYVTTSKGLEFLEAYKTYARTNRTLEKCLSNIHVEKKRLEKFCSKE